MKIILALLLAVSPCSAQMLPANVKDRATSENLEWLYEQIQRAINGGLSGAYIPLAAPFGGDVTGTYGATVVGNDSHTHGNTTITASFAGDVTGTFGATVVGDDSHTHSNATVTGLAASKLTGPLPAIDGSALTGIGEGGVFQLDEGGNITPDDIIVMDGLWEVVGNDIIPL